MTLLLCMVTSSPILPYILRPIPLVTALDGKVQTPLLVLPYFPSLRFRKAALDSSIIRKNLHARPFPHCIFISTTRATPDGKETSGLPLLELLLENHTPIRSDTRKASLVPTWANRPPNGSNVTWLPNRTPRRPNIKGDTRWQLVTSCIVPDQY